MHIEKSEIHLWQLNLADFDHAEVEATCLPWLTEPELLRYRRYQFDKHRKQLLLARVLKRCVLSRYHDGIEPADWQFSHNAYGKPALEAAQNAQSLSFNLSHSGARAVFAVARQGDIGVDIEYAVKPRRIEAIAQRYFSPSEVSDLLALPAAEQQARFYDLWTLKEAYIKACGMGLAIPLQHFSYGFEGSDRLSIAFDAEREDSEEGWQFWQLDSTPDYRLALASKTDAKKPAQQIKGWQFNSLDSAEPLEWEIVRSKSR